MGVPCSTAHFTTSNFPLSTHAGRGSASIFSLASIQSCPAQHMNVAPSCGRGHRSVIPWTPRGHSYPLQGLKMPSIRSRCTCALIQPLYGFNLLPRYLFAVLRFSRLSFFRPICDNIHARNSSWPCRAAALLPCLTAMGTQGHY